MNESAKATIKINLLKIIISFTSLPAWNHGPHQARYYAIINLLVRMRRSEIAALPQPGH